MVQFNEEMSNYIGSISQGRRREEQTNNKNKRTQGGEKQTQQLCLFSPPSVNMAHKTERLSCSCLILY